MARLPNCCVSHPSPGLLLEIQRSPGLLQFNQEFVPNISHTQHMPSSTHYPPSTPPLVFQCTAIVPSCGPLHAALICVVLYLDLHMYTLYVVLLRSGILYSMNHAVVCGPLCLSLDWQLAIWQSALPAICKSSAREKFSTVASVCPLDKGHIYLMTKLRCCGDADAICQQNSDAS